MGILIILLFSSPFSILPSLFKKSDTKSSQTIIDAGKEQMKEPGKETTQGGSDREGKGASSVQNKLFSDSPSVIFVTDTSLRFGDVVPIIHSMRHNSANTLILIEPGMDVPAAIGKLN